jgi:Protein of unknown function (DUF2587)
MAGVTDNPGQAQPQLIVMPAGPPPVTVGEGQAGDDGSQSVAQPGKVMRIGTMIRQMLEEVRQTPLDEASRIRLREVYDASLRELQDGLSPDLSAELTRMAPYFHPEKVPTDAELRVAQAQLVGWLEGLFHGIQATIFAQQMAQRQVDEPHRRGLPSAGGGRDDDRLAPPGTYL